MVEVLKNSVQRNTFATRAVKTASQINKERAFIWGA
jgi:hypothetical protein